MAEHEAVRTLVKSAPELWAQCSDADSLARHLHAFGEIRITRLEPESTVAWEGERARGTVRLESSGWGTKVTLTAELPGPPEVAPARQPARPNRLRAWLTGRVGRGTRPGSAPVERGTHEPEAPHSRAEALDAALNSLGQAHHRPFSRS